MKKAKKQLKKPSQLKKTRTKQNYKHFIIVAIIVIISAIVFYPSLKNGFTNWDDPRYVTESEIIQDLSFENIIKIFSEPYFMNYHPLTILSYALEYNYDKINPKVYHTTNYIFHLLNIVLVFILFYFISKRNLIIPSTVAFLFALHPMHVESVAWVAERKDVLYALFFLGSLITYVKFIENKNTKWYIFTIVLFILSLLSKPMAVTLPVVLVLLDYFYKRKFNTKLVLEKVPFFVLALLFGIIAIIIQEGAIAKEGAVSYVEKFLVGFYGLNIYIYRIFVPTELSTFYPYPRYDEIGGYLPTIFYLAPIISLIVVSLLGLIVFKSKKYARVIIFGFLFYAATISIVLQFLSVGKALIADRYTYIPYLGIFFIIAYAANDFATGKKAKVMKSILVLIGIIYAVFIIALTHQRIKVWENSETLWTDVLKNYPDADMAYRNRGNYYGKTDRPDLAMKDYQVLMTNNQMDDETWGNLGNIYRMQEKYEDAFECYDKAVKMGPHEINAHINRGIINSILKKYDDAFVDFENALERGARIDKVAGNRAFAYLYSGEFDKAITDFDIMIRVNPNDINLYLNKGFAYFQKNEFDEANKNFEIVLKLNPKHAGAYYNMSVCNLRLKNYEKALDQALQSRKLGRKIEDSYINQIQDLVKSK
ncbi:MAG: tetratricopeptide repeat protein [Bacteroidetes bacterium]|jgi:protein O-mannosyl-transferase|nr:tetratricopeptide repeat protein [Bacteroidota bacterium]MBT6687482.1 tetratricopeptide repeat protein [Bacteroidota bacterium]MBT7142668.1 tetratricopeptide repeat protein [Bacteroidota bacterium]MBT7491073.1 tetratricopeptide repeat protein [Bacteroidota bacterium]